MISTGFVPGDVQIATGAGNLPVFSPYAEEILTSYEIGSKNRFVADRLQINGDIFYYRYGGYQQVVNPTPINPASAFMTNVPARIEGAEFETVYQITDHDRLALSYTYTNAYYVDEPAQFLAAVVQTHVAGVVPQTAMGSYLHIFDLPGGSKLEARVAGRFLAAHDLASVGQELAAQGGGAYIRVDSQLIGDVTGTWTTGDGRYSVTGYVRNLSDNRYTTGVQLQQVVPLVANGTQYDPRTYGLMLSARW